MPAKKDLFNAFFDSIMKAEGFSMKREDLVKVMSDGFKMGFPTPGKTIDRFPELASAWNQTIAPMKNNEKTVEVGMKEVQAKFKSLLTS
jgi:ABC-type glycerol-3-phosphate transport system substrate-binding protein